MDQHPEVMTVSPNGFWHLSLPHSLYLGGTNNIQYLPYNLKERGSFAGCIQKVQLNAISFELLVCDIAMRCITHWMCPHVANETWASEFGEERLDFYGTHTRSLTHDERQMRHTDKWLRSTRFLIKTIQIARLIVQWERTAIIRSFVNRLSNCEQSAAANGNKSYR